MRSKVLARARVGVSVGVLSVRLLLNIVRTRLPTAIFLDFYVAEFWEKFQYANRVARVSDQFSDGSNFGRLYQRY